MNREDQEIAEMIATLRQTEPDDRHGVSIERAMKTGRRKVYTRRSVGVLTAMAAVVAVSVASTAIGNQFTSELPPAATQGRFDVWTQEFDVGSGGGFTPVTYETGDRQQVITLRPEKPEGALKEATGTVRLWPVGRPFEFDRKSQPDRPFLIPAEQRPGLSGGPAYLVRHTQNSVAIAWQWTEGAWGYVTVDGPQIQAEDPIGIVDRLIHIAESVHHGPGRPVKIPFTLTKDLDPFSNGVQLRGIISSIGRPGERRSVALRLAVPEPRESDELWFTVGVQPSGRSGKANSTVAGKPAIQTAGKIVIMNVGHGYDVVAKAKEAHYGPMIDALAVAVRLVPNPLDEKNWTDDPVR